MQSQGMSSILVNMEQLPNVMERRRINDELDHSIKNLHDLKNKYKTEDANYFIDPTQGKKSRFVDYNPNMYNIDLGTPTCMSAVCVTNDDLNRFRINPNVDNNWRPSEEQYTLNPKSNQLVSKWELDQRQQLKIYPHMYSAQTDLINEANKPWKGGIERGGVDYPIPMRFQLRYLQQPPPASGGVDYDVRSRNNASVPDSFNGQVDEWGQYQDIRSTGNCNSVNGQNSRVADPRLENVFNRLHSGERVAKDEIRRKARSVGVYDPPQNWLENQQCERERQQDMAIRSQQYNWYQYKGVPRQGETFTTRAKPQPTTTITRNGAPPSAQKSSFFGLGPPLPPPNPELLSAVDSNLLASPKTTGSAEVDKYIREREAIVPMETALSRYDSIKGLQKASLNPIVLPTDLDWGMGNQTAINNATNLFETKGSGVESMDGSIGSSSANRPEMNFMTNKCLSPGGDVMEEDQLLPDHLNHLNHTVDPTNISNMILAKKYAIQRIDYQLAHLDRLLPVTRQRQVRAKDTSHIMDIHKTTDMIDQIEKTRNQLRLTKDRINEEIGRWEGKLPNTQKVPDVPENRMYSHFFSKTAFGVGLFYTEESFGGQAINLTEGFYDYPEVGGVGNNNLRSFKIPKDMIIFLYTKPQKQGIRLKYTGPARITALPARFSRQISGIELVRSAPPYECVCFDGPAFQGAVVPLRSGFYDFPQVGGIGNRKLSSFKIPRELMVTLFSRPNKSGNKITYIGPVEIANLPVGWTNQVSGIEIQIKK